MTKWATRRVTDEYREIVNLETGVVRKVPFASDKQWNYLETLRLEAAKNKDTHTRLKNRPTVFACSKAIDKLLKKKTQQTLL